MWYDSRGLEKWRHRVWHGRVEARDEKRGTGLAPETTARNKSQMVNQRNADLELAKTGFRDNKENKEIVSNTLKAAIYSKNSCKVELQTNKEIGIKLFPQTY